MKSVILSLVMLAAGLSASAQTLDKMNWFNEPSDWNIHNNSLTMSVTPKSDYWRISHYGFTVDDAPFYYAEYGGAPLLGLKGLAIVCHGRSNATAMTNAIKMGGTFVRKGTNGRLAETILANEELTRFSRSV